MKKFIFFMAVFYNLFFISDLSAAENKKIIHYFLAEKSSEPFQITEKNGKKSGIVTEIIQPIFEYIHYGIDYMEMPILRLKNELDIIKKNGPTAIKPFMMYSSLDWEGKDTNFTYTMPIFKMKTVLIMSQKKYFPYQKISDLFGKKIILIKGFDYPEIDPYIGNNDQKIQVYWVKSALQALQIIADPERNEVAFVDLDIRAKYVIKKNNLGVQNFKYEDFSKMIQPIPIQLFMSADFPKTDLDKMNKKILSMTQNHEIQQIIEKYE